MYMYHLYVHPLWVGVKYAHRFRSSYEATKRASRWQRVYSVDYVGFLSQSGLHVVQHVADWVKPFPRRQHSPPLLLKFLHTPPSPPPCTRISGNLHHMFKLVYLYYSS